MLLRIQVSNDKPLKLKLRDKDGILKKVTLNPIEINEDGKTSYKYGIGIGSDIEKGILPEERTCLEKVDMCLKHIEYLKRIKPEKLVCLEIRNHIAWYLKGLKNSNLVKEKIYKMNKVCDIINILNEFKEGYHE